MTEQNISRNFKSSYIGKIEEQRRDVIDTVHSITRFYLILTTLLLTTGCLFAGLTGLLAWKRWYMDNNIKWFFVTSLLASVLSMISIICAIVTIVLVSHKLSMLNHSKVKIHLHIHVLLLSIIELVFSVISTVIAFAGMKNNYPDEIVIPNGGGKIEVNTVMKGNKKNKISPPDIINHFHMTEKFAKYFPKKDNNYLPKAESNSEYQERVRKFLSSETTENSVTRY
ncbi:sodium/chloride dependent transporter [Holotrichia oblita]|uniref:Sodium/chloride dependent transporter n=1 Tax=Holotrichia oblita TaxID=644536 RepID=A0ACB9TLD2_HOLOL|nr:sodium/chloride dependent transporter [Holotrichia oblita]